jgi:hypothetical protein
MSLVGFVTILTILFLRFPATLNEHHEAERASLQKEPAL